MFPKSNLHTHTTFCDGKVEPEAMVRAAVEKGMATLGFSGHATMVGAGANWSMSEEGTSLYRAEIIRLKREFSDRIEIALGVEQDIFSVSPTDGYDYVIGAVHYVQKDGQLSAVDNSAAEFDRGVNLLYGGDVYAFIGDYYELVSKIPRITGGRNPRKNNKI